MAFLQTKPFNNITPVYQLKFNHINLKKQISQHHHRGTPPKFNIVPEKLPSQQERIVFQAPFFRDCINLRGCTQKNNNKQIQQHHHKQPTSQPTNQPLFCFGSIVMAHPSQWLYPKKQINHSIVFWLHRNSTKPPSKPSQVVIRFLAFKKFRYCFIDAWHLRRNVLPRWIGDKSQKWRCIGQLGRFFKQIWSKRGFSMFFHDVCFST